MTNGYAPYGTEGILFVYWSVPLSVCPSDEWSESIWLNDRARFWIGGYPWLTYSYYCAWYTS